MSVLDTVHSQRRHVLASDGVNFEKLSEWQLARDVEFGNGKNGEQVISDINGQLTASDGTSFKFGINEKGQYGYIITDSEGADTVIPFKTGYKIYTRKYNSNEATWRIPTNSSGNTSTTVGVLGRDTWTSLSNGTYKYGKGFILPLTEFEDLNYIYENPDKIKYVKVKLYPTVNSSSYSGYYEFRLAKSSGYMYYNYLDWFTEVTDWKKDSDGKYIYGITDLVSSPNADTRYMINVCIFDGSDGTQPRIDFLDWTDVVLDYQFKGYMGYELTIVYE